MVKKAPEQPEPKKILYDQVNPVTIDGRKFVREENPSFEQDIHMLDMVDKMGLSSVELQTIVDAKMDKEVNRVILEAYRSGVMFEMLGTAMVEEGKSEEWTPEVATEVGELFRYTRDAEAREMLERNTVFLLMSFFVSGLFSSEISRNSSLRDLIVKGRESLSAEISGESSNSGSGSPLSERSQRAIRFVQKRSESGRSGKGS